jgi:hypothetical protein
MSVVYYLEDIITAFILFGLIRTGHVAKFHVFLYAFNNGHLYTRTFFWAESHFDFYKFVILHLALHIFFNYWCECNLMQRVHQIQRLNYNKTFFHDVISAYVIFVYLKVFNL